MYNKSHPGGRMNGELLLNEDSLLEKRNSFGNIL